MRSFICRGENGESISAGTTRYIGFNCADIGANTSSTFTRTPIYYDSNITKYHADVSTNAATATSTVDVQVNGSTIGFTLSIPSSTTGDFSDYTQLQVLSSTDDVNFKLIAGTGGAVVFRSVGAVIYSNRYARTLLNFPSQVSTDSATRFSIIGSRALGVNTTETNTNIPIGVSGIMKDMFIYASSNARITTSVYTLRQNGSDTALTISIGSGATGNFSDTTNVVTISANDLLDVQSVTDTGGGTLGSTNAHVTFESNEYSLIASARSAGTSFTTSLTRYIRPYGNLDAQATESDTQLEFPLKGTASNLSCYLTSNTISATSTLTFRNNASGGNQTISITASTSGAYTDSSNTDSIAIQDDICYELVTGGTGTSLLINSITMAFSEDSIATKSGVTKANVKTADTITTANIDSFNDFQ